MVPPIHLDFGVTSLSMMVCLWGPIESGQGLLQVTQIYCWIAIFFLLEGDPSLKNLSPISVGFFSTWPPLPFLHILTILWSLIYKHVLHIYFFIGNDTCYNIIYIYIHLLAWEPSSHGSGVDLGPWGKQRGGLQKLGPGRCEIGTQSGDGEDGERYLRVILHFAMENGPS